jgi:hypothetical protein
LRAAALATVALLAGCSSPQEPVSQWERDNRELLTAPQSGPLTPPPYPKNGNLIEFYVGPTASFRYFIDGSTLNVLTKQHEVRYVLVARSPSGVENVSFEAIRCPDMHRVNAVGGAGGTWSARPGEWQEIQKRTGLGWPSVLSRQFFCPHRDTIQSVAEGVEALRLGAHPTVYVEEKVYR